MLERLVSAVRERTTARTLRLLAAVPTAEQAAVLETILVPEGSRRVSKLDRLRRSPTDISSAGGPRRPGGRPVEQPAQLVLAMMTLAVTGHATADVIAAAHLALATQL